MSEKIWVIEDNSEKEVSAAKTDQRNVSTSQQKSTERRNPSLAYSLSLILWGCGQYYNRQWRLGTLFLFFMILFSASMSMTVIYWESIQSSFESINVNYSETVLMFSFLYLLGLIVWHVNAWQAYFKSIKINQKSPNGIKGTVLPAVCSFLMPGWGQFLNGQTKKALFFQLFSLTGLAALPFILTTFLIWTALESSQSRLIIEWIFSITIILSPFILLIWIVNIFDAVKVSMDQTKKEPLNKRIKYVIKRFRYHVQAYGWKNTLLPLIKRNILVILLMVFCIINLHYVPKRFYMQQLLSLGDRMSEKEMTVIPAFIKKLPLY